MTDEATTFVAGEIKDSGNTTGSITLASDTFSEIEFAIQATTNALDGTAYCFRLSNVNTYTRYAKATTLAGTATITQNSYRFYVDSDSTNPTDPWGNPDLAENAILAVLPAKNAPPDNSAELRLRVSLAIGSSTLSASSTQFKLQYKIGTDSSCTTGSWTDVGAGQPWTFASSSVSDGAVITAVLSASDVNGHYAKSNPTVTNTNAVSVGQDIEYDFHIVGTTATSTKTYSFRVVKNDGSTLTGYTNCPTLTIRPETGDLLRHGMFFSEEIEKGSFFAD